MKDETITLPRDQTLADYEELGRLRAMLDSLEAAEQQSRGWDVRDAFLSRQVCAVMDSYRQSLMADANEDVQPEIPTEAEMDELARVDAIIRKTGRAPHEL